MNSMSMLEPSCLACSAVSRLKGGVLKSNSWSCLLTLLTCEVEKKRGGP
jgi:hypothetical protein